LKEKIFNLHLFNQKFAVFPQQVFREIFDFHYFMNFNDWFSHEDDFIALKIFLEALNEPYLYCAVPEFYNCPDLKIDMSLGLEIFESEYLLRNYDGHINQNIGLRICPEALWYGESGDWAMVSDFTNDIVIVGCKSDAALNFRADFDGKYFGIEKVIQNMEEFQYELQKTNNPLAKYAEMDNKQSIIEAYK
jgi:hypothetical protein